jgi:alpha-glucosidase (family GH31 glycosyl hydrolase)
MMSPWSMASGRTPARTRERLGVAALCALGLLPGCDRPPPSVTATLAGLSVRVESSPARLVVTSADGRVLLDGVPGGLGGTTPSATGLAFRSVKALIESNFGSFRFDETRAPPWSGVERLTSLTATPEAVRFTFADGGEGELRAEEPGREGALRLRISRTGANRASLAFACRPDEHFLGFGAQAYDVDHRGQTVPLWVSEQGIGKYPDDEDRVDWYLSGTRHSSYFPVPFFLSSRGYGLEVDTSRRVVVALCSERQEVARVEAWDGVLSLVLDDGPRPLDVIARRSARRGRPPAPPAFAFAPWNDAVKGAAEVRRVAKLIRDNRVPASVIWTEDWAGGVQSGNNYNLTYNLVPDRTLYPDIEAMIGELHASGFKFLGYFNTFVERDSKQFAEARDRGFLVKRKDGTPYLFDGVRFSPTGLVDLSNPAARAWMEAAMVAAIDLGIDGWMADFAEWMPVDALLTEPMPTPSGPTTDAEAWHNLYPVEWQRLNERVFDARSADGVERLSFVRSGWLGSESTRHQVVWAGDQSTDFDRGDGLPSVIPIGLGLGVVGLPYYGSDVAGYFSGLRTPFATRELFFRWTALGALTPLMRTHHGVASGKNWRFDEDADTLAHWARWARLHTRLYPLWEALSREAVSTGAPLMRAVALEFPEEEATWPLTDQYLLGASLLVAPVVTQGATSRAVYLPAGRWLRAFDDDRDPAPRSAPLDGPRTVTVDAPLTEAPVFARAGTLLPLLPERIETLAPSMPPVVGLADVGDDRELLVFLGAPGRFDETAGRSYLLEGGAAPTNASTLALSWQGAALAACAPAPVAPCAAVDAPKRQARAYVTGSGALALSDGGARVLVEGGRPDRALVVTLRW